MAANGSAYFGHTVKFKITCDTAECQCSGTAAAGYAEAAIRICSAIIDDPKTSDQSHADAFVNRALARNFQRRYEDAVDDATQGLAIYFKQNDTSAMAGAYYRRAQAYVQMNDDKDADDDFTAAIADSSQNMNFPFERGTAYLLDGKSDLAYADFQKIIDSAGPQKIPSGNIAVTFTNTGSKGYFGRGAVFFFAAQYDQAAKDFAKALALEPSGTQAAFWLHYTRLRQGDDDSAELAANTAHLDANSREWRIAQLFAGKLGLADIPRDSIAPDGRVVSDGACEASLAEAEWTSFTKHDDAAAKPLYQGVVSDCPRSFDVLLAQSMLRRIAANLPR